MFVRTGYQLNLVQYSPPRCEGGCEFQKVESFWSSQKAQTWWIVDDVVTRVVR